MKKKSMISVVVAFFFTVSFLASGTNNPTKKTTMPDNVKTVIENSCFSCHNTNSKNEKGVKALDFKKLDELSMIKQISAYKEIGDVVEEGEMPPKKFIDRYPDKKLSKADKKLLMEWSKSEAEALVKSK